jgi:pimeloyl-ACP methyl ester carboxylesterase
LEDLDFVVDHLRAKFGADTIALIGHSWGSALGLLYTRRHPEKVAAFVGVRQFVSGIEGQRAQ